MRKSRSRSMRRACPNWLTALPPTRHGLVMLMGKGGVGKTTLAAAVAVELARRGLPVHLTTSDPAAHLAETLHGSMSNLTVSRIDPHAETERYRREVLAAKGAKLDAEGRALLEEDLRSPCTEEIAVFQAFSRIIVDAGKKFVVMDTAPTGHTLLLLDATGAYHREITRQINTKGVRFVTPMMQLQNPKRTKVLLVTLAETTPVLEAANLQADLRRAGIEPWAWVINNSVAAARPHSPLLRQRARNELREMEAVASRHATRYAVVPLLRDEPVCRCGSSAGLEGPCPGASLTTSTKRPRIKREIPHERNGSLRERPCNAESARPAMGKFERYLTLWVALCIVAGVALGHAVPSLFHVLGAATVAEVNLPVAVLVWLMIVPMLLKIDLAALGEVRAHWRGIAVTVGINWLVKPFSMALLGWLFIGSLFRPFLPAGQIDAYIAGLILLAAAPCTAMVFVWSNLVQGEPHFTLSQVALNDTIMVVAFAPIVALLLGLSSITVPWNTLLLSAVLYIVVPVIVAQFWRRMLLMRGGQASLVAASHRPLHHRRGSTAALLARNAPESLSQWNCRRTSEVAGPS